MAGVLLTTNPLVLHELDQLISVLAGPKGCNDTLTQGSGKPKFFRSRTEI